MSIYDKIVITGGAGMLAHALVDCLQNRGITATSFSRADCDITNDSSVACLFALSPTLLLNCAAHTKVDLCESEPEKANAINGNAVGKLAAQCRLHNTLMVQVSTDFVFDESIRRPHQPTDPVNPMQAYGRSKLLGETELQNNAPNDWLIIRTAWVSGSTAGTA
jgi:dTDP-4-dehydrorhamnose reductase